MNKISGKFVVLIGAVVFSLPYGALAMLQESGSQEGGGSYQGKRTQEMEERRMQMKEDRENRQSKNAEERQANRQENFCEQLSGRIESMQSRLIERKRAFVDRRENRGDLLGGKRDDRDNALNDTRETQDERRNSWYAKLEVAADTDAKKDAVTEFRKTVENAVETRRDAVNAAIESYRNSVDALVASQKETRTSALDAFSSAMEAAAAQAKSDCEAGKGAATIRSTFQTSLKSANTQLQSERKENTNLSTTLKGLVETKRTAMKSAHNTFKSTLERARVNLKAAFGEGTIK